MLRLPTCWKGNLSKMRTKCSLFSLYLKDRERRNTTSAIKCSCKGLFQQSPPSCRLHALEGRLCLWKLPEPLSPESCLRASLITSCSGSDGETDPSASSRMDTSQLPCPQSPQSPLSPRDMATGTPGRGLERSHQLRAGEGWGLTLTHGNGQFVSLNENWEDTFFTGWQRKHR